MTPRDYMLRALKLARRGEGAVEPNPMVGCVIVRGGEVIGQGWHKKFGGPHAEVVALEDCRKKNNDPAGAHAYVTLEPCCHQGKTPPCTRALIDAGISSISAAIVDPFPKVKGGGVAALTAAGIQVDVGLCEQESRELLAPFLMRVTHGRPWMIAKWAQTIDGKIATCMGDSRWISNEASRAIVHEIRARVDAVMIGVGTAEADDPQLTARDVKIKRIARRVVVDPSLRIREISKLISTAREIPVMVATRVESQVGAKADRLRALGAEIVGIPERGGSLDLAALLSHLSQTHAATNVLVEGGPRLLGALMDRKLVDELRLFVAPKILGDSAGISAIAGASRSLMSESAAWSLRETRCVGEDVELRYLAQR